MTLQTQWQNLLARLTPEYFAEKVLPGAINVLVILILMLLALRTARGVTNRVFRMFHKTKDNGEFQKRADTLASVVRNILNVTILSVGMIMILGELKINIAPVLATAGIVGVAVGFGAQTLVQDVIAGFFILLHDQIRVGDVVDIAGKSGLVERVDLRMTTLRDMSGNVHYVRHGKIDVITNMTKDYSHFVFDIPIAYNEDVDEIIEIIRKIHEDMRADPAFKDDVVAPIEVMGIDRFEESALIIRARTTTRPSKQWRVAREFNRRLKRAFDEKNIGMPSRNLTIYIGKDEDGNIPSFRVVAAGKEDVSGIA